MAITPQGDYYKAVQVQTRLTTWNARFIYVYSIPSALYCRLGKKATINQLTTMLTTSKNVLFPGHNHPANHLYWWPDTLIITRVPVATVWVCVFNDTWSQKGHSVSYDCSLFCACKSPNQTSGHMLSGCQLCNCKQPLNFLMTLSG